MTSFDCFRPCKCLWKHKWLCRIQNEDHHLISRGHSPVDELFHVCVCGCFCVHAVFASEWLCFPSGFIWRAPSARHAWPRSLRFPPRRFGPSFDLINFSAIFVLCKHNYLLPCLAKLLGHFPTPVNSLFPLERGRKNTNQNKKLRAPGNCRLALWTDFLTCFQPRGEKPLGSVLDTAWSCMTVLRQTTRTFLISVNLFRVPWSVYSLCSTSRFGCTAQLILIRKWKYTYICS